MTVANDREKLIELVKHARMDADLCCGEHLCSNCPNGKYCIDGFAADFLIAHGVTFATDTNVGDKWRPASEPPEEPMEYIVMIKGVANSTTLLFDGRLWFEEDPEGWRTYYEVTHWMPLPEPPEEGKPGQS